jgi:hypothetical protein
MRGGGWGSASRKLSWDDGGAGRGNPSIGDLQGTKSRVCTLHLDRWNPDGPFLGYVDRVRVQGKVFTVLDLKTDQPPQQDVAA